MIRQFFQHSLVYGVANLLARGLSLFLIPLYTRVLSPGEYGVLDILSIVGNFVNLFITLEITQGFARLSSDLESDEERCEFASTALWFVVIMYAVFTCIAMLLSEYLAHVIVGSSTWSGVIRLMIVFVAINGVLSVLQSQLRWSLQTRNYAIVSVVVMAVTVCSSVFFVLLLNYGIVGIVVSQILGVVAGAGLSYVLSRSFFKLRFVWRKCKEMLQFSIPLIPSSINVFIALYLDRIAIKQVMTLSDVGLYGVAYRFASVVGLLMIGFNNSLTPLIYNKYKLASTPCEIARIFRYFLMLALSALILIAAFAREILVVFTTDIYYDAWPLMPVIAGGILFSSMYIFMPGMDIGKKTKNISVVNIISGMVNIPLNFALIPLIGTMGAAVATLCSSILMFVLYVNQSQKYYRVPHEWLRICLAMISCAVAVVLLLWVQLPATWSSYWLVAAKFLMSSAVIMIVLALLLKRDDFNNFKPAISG